MIGTNTNETLCSALAPKTTIPLIPEVEETCVPIETDMMTYLLSVIVGAGSFLTFLVGAIIINKCGKRLVSSVSIWIFAALVIMIPFLGDGPYTVVAMVTTALAFSALAIASTSSIIVDLFPTDHRLVSKFLFNRVCKVSNALTRIHLTIKI